MAAGLAVGMRLDGLTVLALAAAVLVGQLSIGWSNDWLDAVRGLDAGREDKPLGVGTVEVEVVRGAAVVAAAAALVLSASLGPVPGVLHVAAVGLGWAYNAWLKATRWSVVPYLTAFGVLPAVVSTAGGHGAPRWWALLAAASFGGGVHLANALPDLDRDRAQGIGGLPQRLGARRCIVGAVVLLGAGASAALLGPVIDAPSRGLTSGTGAAGPWGGLAIVGVLLAGVIAAAVRGRLRLAFRGTMLVGLIVVGALVVQGGRIAG